MSYTLKFKTCEGRDIWLAANPYEEVVIYVQDNLFCVDVWKSL